MESYDGLICGTLALLAPCFGARFPGIERIVGTSGSDIRAVSLSGRVA
jgi:hypothetical protein